MPTDKLNEPEESQKRIWGGYSEIVIDHARNPRNVGTLANADGHAVITPHDCRDTLEIWLRVKNDIIQEATFWTDGCAATVAALSITTELARGKKVIEAFKITSKNILDALGGLPEGNIHNAELAANTLKAAIKSYLTVKDQPWKKLYRKQ